VIPITIDWRRRFFGFDFGEWHIERGGDNRFTFGIVPFWSIVLPLTALSAFLLIPKPKQSTKKKIIEPNVNEGAAS
jgi:hypothetical protein